MAYEQNKIYQERFNTQRMLYHSLSEVYDQYPIKLLYIQKIFLICLFNHQILIFYIEYNVQIK